MRKKSGSRTKIAIVSKEMSKYYVVSFCKIIFFFNVGRTNKIGSTKGGEKTRDDQLFCFLVHNT